MEPKQNGKALGRSKQKDVGGQNIGFPPVGRAVGEIEWQGVGVNIVECFVHFGKWQRDLFAE